MDQFLIRLSRVDGSAIKTLFFRRRKEAIVAANAIGFVFWGCHAFKRSECRDKVSHVQDGFRIDFIAEVAPPIEQAQGEQCELPFAMSV